MNHRILGMVAIMLFWAALMMASTDGNAKEKVFVIGDASPVTTLDPAKRKQMYHAIQKRLMEDLPAVPLFMMQYPTPYRPDVIAGFPDKDPIWGFDFYPIRLLEKK